MSEIQYASLVFGSVCHYEVCTPKFTRLCPSCYILHPRDATEKRVTHCGTCAFAHVRVVGQDTSKSSGIITHAKTDASSGQSKQISLTNIFPFVRCSVATPILNSSYFVDLFSTPKVGYSFGHTFGRHSDRAGNSAKGFQQHDFKTFVNELRMLPLSEHQAYLDRRRQSTEVVSRVSVRIALPELPLIDSSIPSLQVQEWHGNWRQETCVSQDCATSARHGQKCLSNVSFGEFDC